jgi:hypothetical protein
MDGECGMQYAAYLFGDWVFFPCVPKFCEFPFFRKADTPENLTVLEHLSHVDALNSMYEYVSLLVVHPSEIITPNQP